MTQPSAWGALSRTLQRQPGPPKVLTPADLLAPAPAEPRADVAVRARDIEGGEGGASAAAQPDEDAFIVHTLDHRRDTLQGLALRYGVPQSAIVLANDLPSSGNLAAAGATLRIPKSAARLVASPALEDREASQRAKLRLLRARHGLSEGEARYYLEECRGDVEAASAMLREDEAREARALASGGAAASAAQTAGGRSVTASAGAAAGGTSAKSAAARAAAPLEIDSGSARRAWEDGGAAAGGHWGSEESEGAPLVERDASGLLRRRGAR